MTIQEILEAHYDAAWNYKGRRECACGYEFTERYSAPLHRAHFAEVLERHMREREANAWESGYGEGALYAVCIRSHPDGLTEQDPKRPTNPYRKESSDGR